MKTMLKGIYDKHNKPLYPDRCNRLINEDKCNFTYGENLRVVYEIDTYWNGTKVIDLEEDDYGFWITTSDGKKYDFVNCDDDVKPWC
ncbi:hypothetical protein [Clostridium sp.]|jgi:hypothetical protein|uniref:hypothetical protein n=1 Tax=Clostridium sp. TaxID=1506 RepID=UPI00258645C4|nr:hypothetical protein [Clostridium sp.]MDF2503867.1 hypothetical protein [Clostridium sp.]